MTVPELTLALLLGDSFEPGFARHSPTAPMVLATDGGPEGQPFDPSLLRCPSDMVVVVGTHFEYVQRWCTRFDQHQCWSFQPGLVALEPRATPVMTCMDRYEWPNQKGALPPVMMTFGEAEDSCQAAGKRICSEFEWELACEGAETRPFPYGWHHEAGACVNDKPYRAYSQQKLSSLSKEVRDDETARLYQAEPSGSRPKCVSPFGAVDLIGNVEEWVRTSRPEWPHVSSLKGGFWAKPWSGCRGTNDSHGPLFRFYEIGFRCCAEPTMASKGAVDVVLHRPPVGEPAFDALRVVGEWR